MPRRFGPIQGAGTSILERESGAQIVPSILGTTVYVGQTEKGDVGELIDCPKLNQYLRRCGSFIDGSETPDNAFDFYEFSEGAGRLYLVRVTDGLELQSTDWNLSRHNGNGEYLQRGLGVEQKNTLVRIKGKNGGRWGGAKRLISFDFTLPGDLTETTLASSEAMLVDEFKGATLKLLGVTTRTYKVIGNDVAGVLTVKSDSKMSSDLAAESPTNNSASVALDTVVRAFTGTGVSAGDKQSLSYVWKDGEENQNSLFGLDILVDGLVVKSYNNLSLDPADKWFIDDVINQDPDNDFVEIEIIWTATFDKDNRPANWWGNYQNFAGSTLTADIAHVRSVTPVGGTDPGFVTDFVYPAKTVRQRITLTFTGAAAFDVTTDADWGAEHLDLPAGAVDSPYAVELTAGTGHAAVDFLPTFTVRDGVDAWVAGDIVVIDVEPFPVDLASGEGLLSGSVLLDGDDANSERAVIDSNTVNTITFANSPVATPTAAGDITADPESSAVISFMTSGGTIEVICDTVGRVDIVYGAEADIGTLVVTLNAAALALGLPATLFSGAADLLKFELSTVYAASSSNKGEDQFFEIVSYPAELNLSTDGTAPNDFTAATFAGARGDSFRVQAPRELRDGYDGDAPSDADYIAAYSTASSVINRLRGRNVGLAKLSTPGITSTIVQQAGLNYASFRNYQYRVQIPSNIVEETSAVDYVNVTLGRNDYGRLIWPSFANVVNKTGNGSVLQALTGAKHGREAKQARDWQGFHKASAGEDVTFPHVISLPTGERVLDHELLNPQGINIIKKLKGRYVAWGDRTISVKPEWKFAHAREYISHISQVLIENFDFIIFALNDPAAREQLIPVFQTFFLPEHKKRAIVGAKLEDAAKIKIDAENNTPLTTAAGDLNAEIDLDVVDVVERFVIAISKAGVTASGA